MTKDDKSPAGAKDAPAGDENLSEEDIWNETRTGTEDTAIEDGSTFRAVTEEEEWGRRQKQDSEDRSNPDDKAEDADDPEDPEHATTDEDEDGDDDKAEEASRLTHKYRSEVGRARAGQPKAAKRAQRYLKELEHLDAAAAAKLEQETKGGEKDDDGEDENDIDKIAEEYGDVVGPLVSEIKSLKKQLSDLSSSRTNADKQRRDEITSELDSIYKEAESSFLEAHPDGMKIVDDNREAFAAWVEDQPKYLRDIYAANRDNLVDGEGAAELVSKFKEAIGQAETSGDAGSDKSETQHRDDKRQRQLRGANTTRSRGRQAASSEPAADAPESEWWDYMAKQEKRASA